MPDTSDTYDRDQFPDRRSLIAWCGSNRDVSEARVSVALNHAEERRGEWFSVKGDPALRVRRTADGRWWLEVARPAGQSAPGGF